ncbi:MAG: DUF4147 domain-containing protein [Candidatus Eisenbacteria bacterium]
MSRRDATIIWYAAVRAVSPGALVGRTVAVEGDRLVAGPHTFDLRKIDRVAVIGAGKAGRPMAEAIESVLGKRLMVAKKLQGWVNVLDEDAGRLSRVVLHGSRQAASPLPTPRGVRGTKAMLNIVRSLGPSDLAICLLSGGGSAMMPAPVPEVPLGAKRQVTGLLSKAGATIGQLNAVRKHLSQVKGGRLAEACLAGTLLCLIISDVVGDRLDTIASGPTVADETTFADALRVFSDLGVSDRVPPEVMNHIRKGVLGRVEDTPKHTSPIVRNLVIGSNAIAIRAAEAKARELGYGVLNLGSYLEGEAKEVGVVLASLALSIKRDGRPLRPPVCLLAGGETTVSRVAPGGKGGRNQELILAAVNHLQERGMDGILMLSGGTDGEDGPTDAAGAIANERTLASVRQLGLVPRHYLERSRSYDFFARAGGHLKTGPTGTNVMDVCVILVR